MQQRSLWHFLSSLTFSLFFSLTLSSQSLFTPLLQRDKTEETKWRSLRSKNPVTILSYNQELYKNLETGTFENLKVTIPTLDGDLYLSLEKSNLFSDDFKVSTDKEASVAYTPSLHYFGKIEDDPGSFVAISFMDDEVTGIIQNSNGNKYIIGRSPALRNNQFVLFDETKLTEKPGASCGAEILPNYQEKLKDVHIPKLENRVAGGCVKIYFELGNSVYTGKGSNVTTATDYITSVFNVVKQLYANDGINVVISEVKVWTTAEPYTNNGNSVNSLNSFGSVVKANFNGNLGQLVRMKSSGGFAGIAWLDVLCSSYFTFNSSSGIQHVAPVSYAEISPSFQVYPTYSWTVNVITHELGHNFGSPHTHDCSWSGGPIDNCASGGCSTTGPAPINGGTIMSYCHNTSNGINFVNGFGPQPKALIQNRVTAGACAVVCGPGTPCNTPTGLTASSITSSSANLSWTTVSGATNYDVQYRVNGSSAWTNAVIATTSSSFNLTGLAANTIYQFQVRTNCGSSSSAFGVQNFTTLTSTPSACNAPTTLTAGSVTTSGASLSWAAISGAVSYTVQYRVNGSSTWSTAGTVAINSISISGLAAATLYEWQVRTNCATTSSTFSNSTFTTLANTVCAAPSSLATSNIATTTATISWASTGAFNYTIEIKTSSSATWIVLGNISGTAANLSGLQAGTSYDWRIKSNCSTGVSAYAQTSFVTSGGTAVCNAPSSLTASSITLSTATLSWPAVAGAVNYTFEYKTSTAAAYTIVTTASTSVALSGLIASTTYNARVKTNCSSTSSVYTLANFNTSAAPAVCNPPTSLTASSITSSTASLSWPAVVGAINYTVEYKTSAAATYTSVTTATTSLAVSGLLASTTYNARVLTNCTSTSSAFTSANFNTSAAPAVCNAPTSIAASSITNSTAVLSWPAVSGASSYSVEYKTTISAAYTVLSTTSLSQSLTGLSASTAYNIRIKTNCGALSSGYTQNTFTTSATVAPCNVPTGLAASNITSSTATIAWTAVSGAVSYALDYKANSSATWVAISASLTTTTFNLSGLSASTIYDWRLRTNCSSGNSAYATSQFTSGVISSTACPGSLDIAENGSIATANLITFNTTQKGRISPSADLDFYKFVVNGAGSLTFSLTNLPADYDLRLYNSTGGAIATSQNGGTASESLTRTLAAGTYYVRVYGWGSANNATICYDLRIQTGTATVEYEENLSNLNLSVTVYPNPVTNQWLSYEIENMMGHAQIQIVDLQGKIIQTHISKVNANRTNVSQLTPGFYLMRIQDAERRSTVVKFLKSN